MQNPPPEKKKSGGIVCIVALVLAAVSFLLAAAALIVSLTRNGERNTDGTVLSYREIFDDVKSSVAEVYCSSEVGSGVVYDASGDYIHILTNHHVVTNSAVDGVRTSVRFTEFGDKIDGEVLGYDEYHDIAVIRIDKKNAGGVEVTAATVGDRPATGERVLAVGNNLGYGIAAFDGIVSKADRMLKVDSKRVPVIAVTSPINPGMSGGGLFDAQGKLVGINTYQTSELKNNGSTTVYGMGYCVPAVLADRIAKAILHEKSGGQSDKLTVSGNMYIEDQIDFESLMMSATFTSDGLKVTALGYDTENPPAYISGRVQVGDTVVSVGGLTVDGDTDFTAVFAECLNYSYESGGEPLKIVYSRDGKTFTVTYTKIFRKNYGVGTL